MNWKDSVVEQKGVPKTRTSMMLNVDYSRHPEVLEWIYKQSEVLGVSKSAIIRAIVFSAYIEDTTAKERE